MTAIKHVILNKTIALQLIMTLTECDNHNRVANKQVVYQRRDLENESSFVIESFVIELYGLSSMPGGHEVR